MPTCTFELIYLNQNARTAQKGQKWDNFTKKPAFQQVLVGENPFFKPQSGTRQGF
jgi:hypothetical protein